MEKQEFTYNAHRLRNDMLRQAMHYLDDADDAEDAVQETLVKLWVARDRIADADKMRNMASVICRNVSLNMLRGVRRTVPVDNAGCDAMASSPQELLEQRECRQKLKQSIEALSDKQQAIIRMRNVENMSYADIAAVIGTTESSVRGMISKARLALLKQLKGTML